MTRLETTEVSRRTIVRTGAKLAYAAPLVAASLGIHSAAAAPVSGGTSCTAGICETRNSCAPGCICRLGDTPDKVVCFGDINAPCGPVCESDADCAPGTACSINCCATKTCQALCGFAAGEAAGVGSPDPQ